MIGNFDYKYKFFNIMKLFFKSVLPLLAVNIVCLNSLVAGVRPSNVDSGLAVVIGSNINKAAFEIPLGMDELIITAFENYCYHFLNKNMVKFQIFTTNDISKTDSLASSFFHKNFTQIIFIKINDYYSTVNKVVTDKHGRKYFSQIDNNLELRVNFQEYNYEDVEWSIDENQRLDEQSKRDWYDTDIKYMRGNENIVGRAEPYEFVIQRVINRLFEYVKLPERKSHNSKKMIPLKIYLGSNLRSSLNFENRNQYQEIIDYASDRFYNDFGFGLSLTQIEMIDSLADEESFYNYQLNSDYHFYTDTIKTYIFRQFDFWDYFKSNSIREIGYSRLGNRVIRIKLFPKREQSGFDWNVYFNSLTLLHEIGHSFGAIHASDYNSIMNYAYSWVGPKTYDPVNAKIIKACMRGKIHPLDAAKYLAFISETLQSSDYGLIDFPSFFYDYLKLENNKKYSAKLRGAIKYRPYLLAIDGYAMLQEGEFEQAANLFREAIRFEPLQASLHYYLSLVTKGTESLQAKRNALMMGYVDAID